MSVMHFALRLSRETLARMPHSMDFAVLFLSVSFVSATQPFNRVVQVGDYASETQTWDRPENMTTTRNNITVSTANGTAVGADLVSNAAAALAAASMVWESSNSAYAAQTLIAAKDLYSFAQAVS